MCQTPLHGHRLRICCTTPTDELTTILQRVVQKFTTNGQNFATFQHLDMSRCWTLALRCGKYVVQQVIEFLWARPLVVLYNMSVAGVRVPGGVWHFGRHMRPFWRFLTCGDLDLDFSPFLCENRHSTYLCPGERSNQFWLFHRRRSSVGQDILPENN